MERRIYRGTLHVDCCEQFEKRTKMEEAEKRKEKKNNVRISIFVVVLLYSQMQKERPLSSRAVCADFLFHSNILTLYVPHNSTSRLVLLFLSALAAPYLFYSHLFSL